MATSDSYDHVMAQHLRRDLPDPLRERTDEDPGTDSDDGDPGDGRVILTVCGFSGSTHSSDEDDVHEEPPPRRKHRKGEESKHSRGPARRAWQE